MNVVLGIHVLSGFVTVVCASVGFFSIIIKKASRVDQLIWLLNIVTIATVITGSILLIGNDNVAAHCVVLGSYIVFSCIAMGLMHRFSFSQLPVTSLVTVQVLGVSLSIFLLL